MNNEKVTFFESLFSKIFIIVFYLVLIFLFLHAQNIYKFFFIKERVVNVYAFRNIISEDVFSEFKKKTGINVHVTYYDTNEEMFAKFRIDKGKGYDVVLPSDYMVELMTNAELLHKLDKSKISNYSKIYKRLLNRFFDPGNKYTLPVYWIPYGIGFNKEVLDYDDVKSWKAVFEEGALREKLDGRKISMLNDALEAFFLGSIYLFQSSRNLNDEQMEKVKDLLKNQKKFIECYTEAGAKYLLLSDIVPLVVIPASRIKDIYSEGSYGFIVPEEGSLMEICSAGIPIASQNVDLAHQLIDFILSKKSGISSFDDYGYIPSNKESFHNIDIKTLFGRSVLFDDKFFDKLHVIHNEIPSHKIEEVWFSVKTS